MTARTHHAPHPLANGHGHARTRPPSTHSLSRGGDSAVPLRPHPLIRGQSFGPTPLAPLTITSGVSTSPTRSIHAGGGGVVGLSTSPSSISTALDDRRAGQVHQAPGRRTSVSSTRSVSTLPSQSSTAHYPSYPHAHSHLQGSKDRTRTLSTISSSSMAALSSLAQLPSTRPSTPQYVSRFPAQGGANLEVVHPLLPSPYLSAHVSILTYRSPLKESFGRVFAAKPQRR
ncbi:hypothetical protein SERLADRAFT_437284 [Serpula lacrymans var. lacrymans S7.9]|uniref:Uncharacterized protein n=1 Tax=Serpula lacrymans var. lacrymans (strain S7.9) TaxID=578457 RepID=F8NT83_SERL9|nr:uncharacterized protein SERLADRAFT_437284 [Serpula lacrymans var. lacrymans S7.9]EGO25556.1 hypothetical protein SERLADRAFT_437284 [Serpula lacrymans var. lacrymans S7.9]